VNSRGQTFVQIRGPLEFGMGSSPREAGRDTDETSHRASIPRSFALAAHETTVAEFQEFLADHPKVLHDYPHELSPEPACPMINVTWYLAAQYCRWLSERENMTEQQMCYPKVDEIGPEMKLPDDFLSRTGYRLPTEAEWEYACRGGTATRFSFGDSDDLAAEYAWYDMNAANRTHPVGQLKPNEYGLFDMHGNVWEWCQDWFANYPAAAAQAVEDLPQTTAGENRVLRGGTFNWGTAYMRSAERNNDKPATRLNAVGFRVARTLPAE
jgi:formylglycine-generating enzyme required for sulfatase activity